MHIGLQSLIGLDHPLMVIQHENAVFHRINDILMGDGYNVEYLVLMDRNDKENRGNHDPQRGKPRNDRQIIVQDNVQQNIDQQEHGYRQNASEHVHNLIFDPGCLV
ncbi:hypothetical protein D3C73_1473700 [compost metagenome]